MEVSKLRKDFLVVVIFLVVSVSVALSVSQSSEKDKGVQKDRLSELAKQDYKGSTGVSVQNVYWTDSEYSSFYKGKLETNFGQNVSFYVTRDGEYLVPEGRFRDLNDTEQSSGHTHPHPHGSGGGHQ